MQKKKFIDINGRSWPSPLGNLKVGSKFRIYGDCLCEVLEVDLESGPGSVVYRWGHRVHLGLPPIKVGDAWCEEEA